MSLRVLSAAAQTTSAEHMTELSPMSLVVGIVRTGTVQAACPAMSQTRCLVASLHHAPACQDCASQAVPRLVIPGGRSA